MNSTFRFRRLSVQLLLAAFSVAVAGCDSSSTYQPPTASVGAARTTAAQADTNSPSEKTTASKPAATAASEPVAKEKFDPVLENGKFFEGWPKPKLALVISGRQDGYLEPCGCAGLENQKGGFNRRHALFKQLQEQGWPLAAVDVGGLVRRFGKQAEVQFGISAEALKQMGYNAVAFGAADLRLSAGEIVAAVAGAQPEDSIFLSANVNLFGLTPKVRIIEAGGMKLGITAVLGKEFQQRVNNAEIEIQPAAEALKTVVGQLKGCDVRILLAHATADECMELARQFPEFDLVVSGDDVDVPRAQPESIPGTKSRLVEVGHKGMYVVVVGFYDDPKQPVRFQRVALDSRFPDTPEMKELMASYQDQ
jgi:2',3'-cyclic-nucleotide 2'-phosphodiesterase (5'-nucleotidase family)